MVINSKLAKEVFNIAKIITLLESNEMSRRGEKGEKEGKERRKEGERRGGERERWEKKRAKGGFSLDRIQHRGAH